jgi:predicted metalloprotease with PDZ domain
MANPPVRYRLFPASPEAHVFEVECTVADPDPAGQRFALPAWIPGSYLVRDFARHIVSIRASAGSGPRARTVALKKIDKHTWQAAALPPGAGPLSVHCEVYAWDLSVRGAHFDTTHAFFNGTSVFLRALGREDRACEVELLPPPGRRYARWRVVTSLSPARGTGAARQYGFGRYAAGNYDELIDHPVEMGEFTLATFRAGGVPHDVAVFGRHRADMARLTRDMRRVCQQQIDLFHAGRGRHGMGKAPFARYVFLVTALGEGYGGLEHRASTALVCSRNDLPTPGMGEAKESYRGFLGLVSHEYFHAWNVKRIKPAAFTPYDLDRENYTSLLWAFEGLTSYYDDLALVRSGLLTREQYLEQLGRNITQLLRTPGRRKQSVADSSFDAWIKYYRQDENTPNAVVSYYGKGSLVGLCLDLLIRSQSNGRRSLDDVMRALWRRHGQSGLGVGEDDIERLAESVTGLALGRQLNAWLRGTAELPLSELLATHGIELALRPAESGADRGGRASSRAAAELRARPVLGVRGAAGSGEYRLTHVLDGGAAQAAGLAAGDVVVAVDGLRVPGGGLDAALAGRRPGETVELHAFRRDELMLFGVRLGTPAADTASLALAAPRNAQERRKAGLRKRWLRG